MGKKVKVSEAHSKEERKKVRKSLGKLKSLTVQPTTKLRYQQGLQSFYRYLRQNDLTIPTRRDLMDDVVADYLEYLWSEGEGRAVASNFLAALQDADPKLKGSLPGSWRLMKAWTIHEVPNRAPPLTESVLRAMCGWSVFTKQFDFGLSLLVAFHGLLRTGELLSLQGYQIHMTSATLPAVISLGLTKSGKRQGAAESVTITDVQVLRHLWHWKQTHSRYAFLTTKPHQWRATFSACCEALKLQDWGFRPYSLRRGGAAALFVKTQSLDHVLLVGRWTAVKTAKIYLNAGLAMLADLKIPLRNISHFHLVFANYQKVPPKLEPALEKSRSGGRGKKPMKVRKPKRGGGALSRFQISSGSFACGSGFPRLGEGLTSIGGYGVCRLGVHTFILGPLMNLTGSMLLLLFFS